MARIARAVAVEYPHHITQRGNYRQTVFKSDKDYILYLEWLKTYAEKYSVRIWAYCLMGNHVHYIAVPMKSDSFAKTFNTLHMRYSQFVNKRGNAAGHLWQGRFFSCALDEKHLYAAVRYVENNPVRAGIVDRADEYRWSSAKAHVSGTEDAVLDKNCYLLSAIKDWKKYLGEDQDDTAVKNIRKHTQSGWPCGNDVFINEIEHLLVRKLSAGPKGRPGKGK
jgi:REP-associated tyrosine transposase